MSESENNSSSKDRRPSDTSPTNGAIGHIRERLASLEQQSKGMASKDWVSKEISEKEAKFFKWLVGVSTTAIIALLITIFRK